MRRMSQPGSTRKCLSLIASRSNRLARLRSTAHPTALPATNPKRRSGRWLRHVTNTTKGCVHDRPERRTLWKSFLPHNRITGLRRGRIGGCYLVLRRRAALPLLVPFQSSCRFTCTRCGASKLRPFNLRAFSTRRPAAVLIRRRKPCTRARRRILG